MISLEKAKSTVALATQGCLGALSIIAGLVAYSYFMLRDPDRLQSEEFVLRQQELTIIERKQGPPIPLNSDLMDEAQGTIDYRAPHARDDQR